VFTFNYLHIDWFWFDWIQQSDMDVLYIYIEGVVYCNIPIFDPKVRNPKLLTPHYSS
jgi:hypothetical protein